MSSDLLRNLDRLLLLVDHVGDHRAPPTVGTGCLNARPAAQHQSQVFLQGIGRVGAAFLRDKERIGGFKCPLFLALPQMEWVDYRNPL